MNITALNEAISYVRELAGEKVNIIWGTVTEEDYDKEKIVVTLIATGMQGENRLVKGVQRPLEKELVLKDYRPVAPRKEVELIMPTFLQEVAAKNGRR